MTRWYAVFSKPLSDQYQALTQAWGLVDVSSRTRIELTGKDRAGFLNGFCTNDIRRLEPGHGCEAFLTNAKGKIVGHVFVFCGPQSLIVETVPDQADPILTHLDRYLIREDVRMLDRTADWGELLLAGPHAGVSLSRWLDSDLDERMREQVWMSLYRIKLGDDDAYLALMPRADLGRRIAQLTARGAVLCSDAALEVLRIEAGWPQFGKDITDANLPQEVNRDALAISFTKGCYLGQETVARLDALGHVNRLLVSVRWLGSTIPVAGEQLEADGQTVGTVTSAVWSPRCNAPLALAYVRTPHHREGTSLQSAAGPAMVVGPRGARVVSK
jgi:tRNA-modifying protein YgfZ